MAAYWDPMWKNAVELHKIFLAAEDDPVKQNTVKSAMKENFKDVDFETDTPYELLSYLNVLGNDDEAWQSLYEGASVEDIKNTAIEMIDERLKWTSGSDLVSRLNRKALLEAKNKIFADANVQAEIKTETIPEINEALKNPTYSNYEVLVFSDADDSGALEGVDQNAVKAYRRAVAALIGFDKVDGKQISTSDNLLNNIIGEIDPAKDESKDLFDDIRGKYKVSFSNGETDEDEKLIANLDEEASAELQNQLLRNAATRAAYDMLTDKEFFEQFSAIDPATATDEQKEDIKNAFKVKIEGNYRRAVVVASLTSSKAPELLKKVKYLEGKDGKYVEAAYLENDDEIIDIINRMEQGEEMKLNMVTVAMDQYDLDGRTAFVEQALKTKTFTDEFVVFARNANEVRKKAWNTMTKRDFWKKLAPKAAVNMAMFGGAIAAMGTGSAGIIAVGAAAYAAWTWVNAKIMPVYDAVMNKLRADPKWKAKSWGQRVASKFKVFFGGGKEFKKLWKETKKEINTRETRHSAFGKTWKRSNTRATEGFVVGAAAGFGALLGGTLGAKLARQGTAIAGKTATLIETGRAEKKADEKLHEVRSIENFNELQNVKAQKKQDAITLGAVVVGTVLADTLFAPKATAGNVHTEAEVSGAVQGGEGAAQGGEGAVQGGEGAAQGGEGAAQGGEGAAQGDEGAVQGDGGAAQEIGAPENMSPEDQAAYDRLIKMVSHRKGVTQLSEQDVNNMLHQMEQGNIIHGSGKFADVKFTMPEGMNKFQVVESYYYMSNWNKGLTSSKILGYLFSTDCDNADRLNAYSAEDIQKAINSLKAIDLGKDRTVTVMINDCEVVRHTHGSLDVDKYNQIMDEKVKMVFTANRNVVEHDPCTGELKAQIIIGKVDCGCNDVPVEETPTPAPEPTPVVEETPAPKPIEQEARTVNAADAKYKFRTTLDNNQDEFVDPASINGKDHGGYIYDEDTVDVVDGKGNTIVKGSNTREVYVVNQPMVEGIKSTAYPMDLTELVKKFPDEPTAITEYKDGSVVYTYESANGGKTWSVVVDAPKDGVSAMHLMQGNREVGMNNSTGDLVAEKISQYGPLKCTHQHDAGNSVENIKFNPKVAAERDGAAAGTAAGFTPKASNVIARGGR